MAKKGKPKKRGRKPIYGEDEQHKDHHTTVHIPNSTKRHMNGLKQKGENYGDLVKVAFDVVEFVGKELGLEQCHPQDVLDELHKKKRLKRKKEEGG